MSLDRLINLLVTITLIEMMAVVIIMALLVGFLAGLLGCQVISRGFHPSNSKRVA